MINFFMLWYILKFYFACECSKYFLVDLNVLPLGQLCARETARSPAIDDITSLECLVYLQRPFFHAIQELLLSCCLHRDIIFLRIISLICKVLLLYSLIAPYNFPFIAFPSFTAITCLIAVFPSKQRFYSRDTCIYFIYNLITLATLSRHLKIFYEYPREVVQ